MTTRTVREYDGMRLVSKFFSENKTSVPVFCGPTAQIGPDTDFNKLKNDNPWLKDKKLVIKADCGFKRRGKAGFVKVNKSIDEIITIAKEWRGKVHTSGNATGPVTHFVVEPFAPHEPKDEMYICMVTHRLNDEILFFNQGGVDVGDIDAKALHSFVPLGISEPTKDQLVKDLFKNVDKSMHDNLASFIQTLYKCFVSYHFAYLEINPVVVNKDGVSVCDLAAKIDETAMYECHKVWGPIEFPPPFGRSLTKEEEYINELASKTGASLKLTVINPKGRIWTLVAGGGASVIYADTICDLGGSSELANYGEYSGDPSENLTFQYAKTVLDLMTREKSDKGKILLIGGGIANFTDVAATFKGIARALTEFADKLKAGNVKIFIRRGGPNYKEGLQRMATLGQDLKLDMKIFGPEANMTSIVAMALEKPFTSFDEYKDEALPKSVGTATATSTDITPEWYHMYTGKTRCIIYGLQLRAAQSMCDFDYISRKKAPSVACIVYGFQPSSFQRFYFGAKEVMIPVIQDLKTACEKFPDASVLINFSSFRAVYETCKDALSFPQFRTLVVIAEGVPERYARLITQECINKKVHFIGPSTVGGVAAGQLRLGNAGGMIDNIIDSKLYRSGSVAYVSRSGGLSNELNNIIARTTDGVYEGVAIGGDRYPGSEFIDHVLRYEANPEVKMIVVLGEVGGILEYDIVKALKDKKIKKPLVAWVYGTCAKYFSTDVQFGHAGASARSQLETAAAKNIALREAGALVPDSFEGFGSAIHTKYIELVKAGIIIPKPPVDYPPIPMDYAWACKMGMVRRKPNFVSTISDDRGEELLYHDMKISDVLNSNIGIGGVIGLLWFRKRLPKFFAGFVELALQVVADHGPAVSGAHNTIVCSRAGKDLISSLVSGMLCIGPRFGGALDGAATLFTEAFDAKKAPREFVDEMRVKKILIQGIGHLIKSKSNPDMRVKCVVEYCKKNFPSTPLLDYALAVEDVTTKKKDTLILNVDGCIGVCFVDALRQSGVFSPTEVTNYIKMGALNGLFVLGRSIGFIGHYLDQKRLNQPLYRHPYDDINYLTGQDLPSN